MAMVLPNTYPAGEREERVNMYEGFLDADMLRNVAADPSDYAAFVCMVYVSPHFFQRQYHCRIAVRSTLHGGEWVSYLHSCCMLLAIIIDYKTEHLF